MAISRQKINFPSINLNKLFFKRVRAIESGTEKLIKNKLKIKNTKILLNNSARDSFYLILKNLRKQTTKNKVLISAFNFSLMPQIIKSGGFEPLYIDVDTITFNLSKDDLIKKISNDCGIAILLHNLGNPVDSSIFKELRKRGIIIIEDCAHTFNSVSPLNKIRIGALGDISVFSFNFSKPLNSIYGSAILLNNPKLQNISQQLDKIKKKEKRTSTIQELKFYSKNLLTSFLFTIPLFDIFTWQLIKLSCVLKKQEDVIDILSKDALNYSPKKIGLLNKFALLSLNKNLKKIENKNNILFKIQKEYDRYLKNTRKQQTNFTRYLYAVLVKNKITVKNLLRKKNIDIKINYCTDVSNGACRNASYLEKHIVYLPFYSSLRNEQIKKISEELLKNNLVIR